MTVPKSQAPLKSFKLMWGALFASQFVYTFVLFNVLVKEPMPPRWLPNFQHPLESAIMLMAFSALTAAFFIPKFIVKSTKESLPEGDLLPADLFAAFIVRLAIVESICLFGFMLGMATKTPTLLVPFLSVSVLIYLKNFPSDAQKVKSDLGL